MKLKRISKNRLISMAMIIPNPSLNTRRMNLAAEEVPVANPEFLHACQMLMQLARAKVDEDGYIYKKGKSKIIFMGLCLRIVKVAENLVKY